MPGHECYHCKQWIAEGEEHDCWTTTEAALTRDLSEDLRDAWERLRETAVEFGDQRIYASHNSIMFSRKSCHFFVRPKRSFLELCIFLGREMKGPQVHKVVRSSKTKVAHLLRIRHRDEVEAPVTDWLLEAYQLQDKTMPFKSQAQRRKFAHLLVEGKITPKTFEEWNRETGAKKLPDHVKPKPKKRVRRKKATARKRPRRSRA